ncbi:tetraacyldisaccharide 4'-kinase [Sulfurovum sp. XGS-02]|uniref:tetraacyldisaccharide 4'-kinase n=1 Tax=Sulfurovum sp. XGS-02 TaxID=2925411 RepID=UPI0020592DB7|nr:tetraacyldisaccharide 4'-kinase [Sulfurovum sp. XGS-02]UPT78070.1 tetraacyldisaccharide 4'-kinase [Sulfurovum sp. XGS-02]
MRAFLEEMFFVPKWYHYPFILLLLPLSILYGIIMSLRRMIISPKEFGIPIISVGNLIVGGSGKTPFVIALASRLEGVVIISRGYGRKSKGLVEVSSEGRILVDVTQSGDEPMLMAQSLPHASVIVSEERALAIALAKEKGAKCIILDDGFNRVEIDKYDIILEPSVVKNYLPFPAGAFREFWFNQKYADIVAKEGEAFHRHVAFENLQPSMVLVTAISNPHRLDAYLPEGVVHKVYLEDHAYFEEEKLKMLLSEHKAQSLLVTEKDAVKMQDFKLPISEMKLKLQIQETIFTQVDEYIKGYRE